MAQRVPEMRQPGGGPGENGWSFRQASAAGLRCGLCQPPWCRLGAAAAARGWGQIRQRRWHLLGTGWCGQRGTARCWEEWGAPCRRHPPPEGVAEEPRWVHRSCSPAMGGGVPCVPGCECGPVPRRRVLPPRPPRAPSLNNSGHRSACCCACFWPRAGHAALLPATPRSCRPPALACPCPRDGTCKGPQEVARSEAGHTSPMPSEPDAGRAAGSTCVANEVFAREAR